MIFREVTQKPHLKRKLYVTTAPGTDAILLRIEGARGGVVDQGEFSRAELLAALGAQEILEAAEPVAVDSEKPIAIDGDLTRRYTVEQQEFGGTGWLVKSSHHARIKAAWAAFDEEQAHAAAGRTVRMRIFDNEKQEVVRVA